MSWASTFLVLSVLSASPRTCTTDLPRAPDCRTERSTWEGFQVHPSQIQEWARVPVPHNLHAAGSVRYAPWAGSSDRPMALTRVRSASVRAWENMECDVTSGVLRGLPNQFDPTKLAVGVCLEP